MAKGENAIEASTDSDLKALLAELVKQNAVQNQTTQAHLKRTAPKSNTASPQISAFNPRGQKDFPMPDLKCEVHMPFPQRPTMHGFTREEVELMNLVEPGDYVIEMADGSTQKVSIIGKKNNDGRIEQMRFAGPFDPDTGTHTALFTRNNKQTFPALANMLRQIVGDAADAVMPMKEEVKRVNQFLKAEDKAAAVTAGALAVSVGE